MVTETSVTGTNEERIAWLNRCVEDIRRLRGDGIPVIGYTWWPLFDHVDWDGAMLHQTGHVHPVGIYSLQRQSDDTLRRTGTPLTDAYGRLLAREDEAVGQLNSKPPVPSPPRSPRAQRSQIRYAPLIVYSRHLWSPVCRRIHHIVARLQRERPVLFVETRWVPDSVPLDARLRQEAGLENLHILSVPLPYSAQLTLDGGRSLKRTAIELALQQEPDLLQFRRSLLWFEDPLDQPIFGQIAEPLGSVFDCHDAYALDQLSSDRSLHWAKPGDLIFFRSRTLFRKFEPALNGRAALVSDGVDPIRFARASREKTRVPFDLDFVRFPVLGFVGTIDQRLDFDVIQALIDDNPVWKIVMIGPVSGVSPEHLCRRAYLLDRPKALPPTRSLSPEI
jgi:hypothetical protein